jgi:hypothetical protein
MKKFLFFVSIFLLSTFSKLIASNDTSFFIKRAYLDTIGIVPSTEEIEWYCVYNSGDSYKLAVETLLKHPKFSWNMSIAQAKEILLSEYYKNSAKRTLTKEQIIVNLFYVVGVPLDTKINKDTIQLSKNKLIQHALKYSDGDTSEAIDYMANCLMCRNTNVKEINELLKIYRSIKNEKDAWLAVVDAILDLEGVKTY